MKLANRIMAVLAAGALMLSTVGFPSGQIYGTPEVLTASAANYTTVQDGDDVTYRVYDTYATMFKCLSSTEMTSYEILAEVSGVPVTGIDYGAFWNCTALTSVTIPDSITEIEGNAFSETSITSIEIPESVTSIGPAAFQGCLSLTSVTIPDSVKEIGSACFGFPSYGMLTPWLSAQFEENDFVVVNGILIATNPALKEEETITVPDGITRIDAGAFTNMSMTSVTIPESVTSIGASAFSECANLESVVIPEGVTSIAGRAFYQCTSLADITIPSTVTDIGTYAFDYTPWLEQQVEENAFVIVNNILIASNPEFYEGATVIPDTVTKLAGGSLYNKSVAQGIYVPASVTYIASTAFPQPGTPPYSVYFAGTEEEWNAAFDRILFIDTGYGTDNAFAIWKYDLQFNTTPGAAPEETTVPTEAATTEPTVYDDNEVAGWTYYGYDAEPFEPERDEYASVMLHIDYAGEEALENAEFSLHVADGAFVMDEVVSDDSRFTVEMTGENTLLFTPLEMFEGERAKFIIQASFEVRLVPTEKFTDAWEGSEFSFSSEWNIPDASASAYVRDGKIKTIERADKSYTIDEINKWMTARISCIPFNPDFNDHATIHISYSFNGEVPLDKLIGNLNLLENEAFELRDVVVTSGDLVIDYLDTENKEFMSYPESKEVTAEIDLLLEPQENTTPDDWKETRFILYMQFLVNGISPQIGMATSTHLYDPNYFGPSETTPAETTMTEAATTETTTTETTTTETTAPETTATAPTASETTTTPGGSTTEPTEPLALGDVNADGNVNAGDSAILLMYVAQLGAGMTDTESDDVIRLTAAQLEAANVNKDDDINAVDAAIILAYSAAAGAGQGDAKIEDFI